MCDHTLTYSRSRVITILQYFILSDRGRFAYMYSMLCIWYFHCIFIISYSCGNLINRQTIFLSGNKKANTRLVIFHLSSQQVTQLTQSQLGALNNDILNIMRRYIQHLISLHLHHQTRAGKLEWNQMAWSDCSVANWMNDSRPDFTRNMQVSAF